MPARQARKYDVYLPIQYNDGRPIPLELFYEVQEELFERFGGITRVQQDFPLLGLWRKEGQVYQDLVIIITVIDQSGDIRNDQFFQEYKETLKARFEQQDVLITAQNLEVF